MADDATDASRKIDERIQEQLDVHLLKPDA